MSRNFFTEGAQIAQASCGHECKPHSRAKSIMDWIIIPISDHCPSCMDLSSAKNMAQGAPKIRNCGPSALPTLSSRATPIVAYIRSPISRRRVLWISQIGGINVIFRAFATRIIGHFPLNFVDKLGELRTFHHPDMPGLKIAAGGRVQCGLHVADVVFRHRFIQKCAARNRVSSASLTESAWLVSRDMSKPPELPEHIITPQDNQWNGSLWITPQAVSVELAYLRHRHVKLNTANAIRPEVSEHMTNNLCLPQRPDCNLIFKIAIKISLRNHPRITRHICRNNAVARAADQRVPVGQVCTFSQPSIGAAGWLKSSSLNFSMSFTHVGTRAQCLAYCVHLRVSTSSKWHTTSVKKFLQYRHPEA